MVHMPSKRNDCGSTIGKVCTERDLKTKDVTEYHLKDDLLHERKHKEIVYETITKDEVLRRVHEGGQKLVIVCGNVYNIERLGDIHPGGRKVLDVSAGQDVTPIFFGCPALSTIRKKDLFRSHTHSFSAYQSLIKYQVAILKEKIVESTGNRNDNINETKNPHCYTHWKDISRKAYLKEREKWKVPEEEDVNTFVDLRKPIVNQICHLTGNKYERWIHSNPYMSTDSPQFFESPVLESCSRAHWYYVPMIWVPVALASLCFSATRPSVTLQSSDSSTLRYNVGSIIPYTLVGYILWILLEYSVHRFLFHLSPISSWGKKLHFVVHGCHHKFPMDKMRLVFPPTAAAPLAFILNACLHLIFPSSVAHAIFSGSVLGYVIYDVTHYALHSNCGALWDRIFPWLTQLRTNHFYHHFVSDNHNFGITSSLMDGIMFTSRPSNERCR